jgi:hypothetical protein
MQNRIDINFDDAGYQTSVTKATEFVAFINSYVKDVKPADRIISHTIIVRKYRTLIGLIRLIYTDFF